MDSMGHVIVDNKNQNRTDRVKTINSFYVTEPTINNYGNNETFSHNNGNFFPRNYMLNNNQSHKQTCKKFATPFGGPGQVKDGQFNIVNNQSKSDLNLN